MNSKKIKVICSILALAVLLLSSCSIGDTAYNCVFNCVDCTATAVERHNEKNGKISPHKYAVETFNEVLELVQVKDKQAIYDKFNEYAKTNANIMPQIDELVEFVDGEVTKIGHVGASNDYSTVKDGVTERAAYTATADIWTEDSTQYWVKVGVITEDKDETKLGVYYIYILNCTLSSEHTDAWVEWDANPSKIKEEEPPIPDNMSIRVGY